MTTEVRNLPKPVDISVTQTPARKRVLPRGAKPIPVSVELMETTEQIFDKFYEYDRKPQDMITWEFYDTKTDTLYKLFKDNTWEFVKFNEDEDTILRYQVANTTIQQFDKLSDLVDYVMKSGTEQKDAPEQDIVYVKYDQDTDTLYKLYGNMTWESHKFDIKKFE